LFLEDKYKGDVMKIYKFLVRKTGLIAVAAVLLLSSCAVQSTGDLIKKSDYRGFTKEMDEPSARGMLKRVSPEQSFVNYRFCISPDGKHIVYSGFQEGETTKTMQLWKITTDGASSPTKLTSGGDENIFSPSMTSDGKWIVFTASGKIWQVSSDGAGGKKKVPGSGGWDYDPAVSSTGRLAFCSWQASGNENIPGTSLIWTSNLDGGDLTQIREGENPQWSPDSKKLVFSYKGDIWLIDADGRNLMQLTNTKDIIEGLPSYSNDGSCIVYTSNEGKQQVKNANQSVDFNIWLMEEDGRNKVQITELKSWDSWPIMFDDNIYFLSGRAKQSKREVQRIWKLEMRDK
jgi:Tol biopolymer transport system component